MKENNLLVICPTRNRPERCERMIESFDQTSSRDTKIVFIIDQDDECYLEYSSMFARKNKRYVINHRMNLTETYNLTVIHYYTDYNFYSQTNDDFIYHTKGWDKILMDKLIDNGGGIAFGDDGYPGSLPTTSVISGAIIRSLGWIHMPTLGYLCNDMVWREIGERLRRLFYVKEVFIEHIHPLTGKIESDETYKKTNSQESFVQDNRAFRVWRDNQMKFDLEKIKEVFK